MNIFLFPSIWLIIAGLLIFCDKPIWWLFTAFAVVFGVFSYGHYNTQSQSKGLKNLIQNLEEGVEDES